MSQNEKQLEIEYRASLMSPLGQAKLPVPLVVYPPKKFVVKRRYIKRETKGASSQNAAFIRLDLSNTATYSVPGKSPYLSHSNSNSPFKQILNMDITPPPPTIPPSKCISVSKLFSRFRMQYCACDFFFFFFVLVIFTHKIWLHFC